MSQEIINQIKYVKGPDGNPLTIDNLPPINTRRWIARRKAEVVAAVNGGLLTIKEACERYHLSIDEFLSWQLSVNNYGMGGLKVTHLQYYRR